MWHPVVASTANLLWRDEAMPSSSLLEMCGLYFNSIKFWRKQDKKRWAQSIIVLWFYKSEVHHGSPGAKIKVQPSVASCYSSTRRLKRQQRDSSPENAAFCNNVAQLVCPHCAQNLNSQLEVTSSRSHWKRHRVGKSIPGASLRGPRQPSRMSLLFSLL